MTRASVRTFLVALAACTGLVACVDSPEQVELDEAPLTDQTEPTPDVTEDQATRPPTTPAPVEDLSGKIVIDVGTPIRSFDHRLLGTNVPAWLGPETLADPVFRQRTMALGTTLLRMPGGSWSNYYEWDACETGDDTRCFWPWAARPSDFLDLMVGTGIPAMWTMNVNGTAQQAAALVAFFNGDVDDEHEIGIDRQGRDWGTTGDWARLRTAGGHLAPAPVRLWEIGNEVFAGKTTGDDECASFGWEDVWTCDGTEYIVGDADHDGFVAFRDAMRAVDPDILVGAVGVSDQTSWGDWGNEVIREAGASLDFYVVHHYGFDGEPELGETLERPTASWPTIMADLRESIALWSPLIDVQVAVTEYNMVAFETADPQALMRRAVNALFTADTIGAMATSGVSIANHWNLANGRAANGTDYGMIDSETLDPTPQYYGMAIWKGFGDELLTVRAGFPSDRSLSAYAGRTTAGSISLVVVNKTDAPIDAIVELEGAAGAYLLSADVLTTPALDSFEVTLNGSSEPTDGVLQAPPGHVGTVNAPFGHQFPPLSVTHLHLEPVT